METYEQIRARTMSKDETILPPISLRLCFGVTTLKALPIPSLPEVFVEEVVDVEEEEDSGDSNGEDLLKEFNSDSLVSNEDNLFNRNCL